MKYTLTFTGQVHQQLEAHLFSSSNEAAAYILCRRSVTQNETRLLTKQLLLVPEKEVLSASGTGMSITQASFLRAIKEADRLKCSFILVHSHPDSVPAHSEQDDMEERSLFRTAHARIHNDGPHASIVATRAGKLTGRVWLEDGSVVPISTFRIIGNQFRFIHRETGEALPVQFDRQVRAFGPDMQSALSKLHIGIVGAGGTGSSVSEQLIRLGAGRLTVVDGGKLEDSNVTRVYGSRLTDVGSDKPGIIARLAEEIGFGTFVRTIVKDCSFLSTMQALKECDIIFGCTDDQWGRSLLSRLAGYYLIPVFDMGVQITAKEDRISTIQGRVTTLMPGTACLYCRDRVTPEGVNAESTTALNPLEATKRRKEGYIPALDAPAASMIPFTTAIAAGAVMEFLHRLTLFARADRTATETLYLFDETRQRTNSRQSTEIRCFCNDDSKIARGDCAPLLDCTWRPE